MSNLFKPKVNLIQPQTDALGFTGGGLRGTAGGGGGGVVADASRTGLINDISGVGTNAANTYGDLYNTVRPGFNDLLSARLQQINDASNAAIGNLRENLSSRRVLGSSFGQDTISRANAEFSRQRDQAIADNFLKSLDAQRQLTADTLNARLRSFQPKLDELNLEASLAANLGSQGAKALADAAQFNAKNQNAANAAGTTGMWSAIGTGLGLAKNAFMPGSGSFGSMFGGGPSVTAGSYGGVPYPIFG